MTKLELYNQISNSIFDKLENQEIILQLLLDMFPAIKKEILLKSDYGARTIICNIIEHSLCCGVAITLDEIVTELQLTDIEVDLFQIIQSNAEIDSYNYNRAANRPNYEKIEKELHSYLEKKSIELPKLSENDIKDLFSD